MAPLPTNEQLLVLFVAELAQRLCHSSVRSYLSAVRHMHIAAGWPDPLANSLRLQLALKGLKRRKPRAKDTRLPITPYILKAIKGSLNSNPYEFNNIMLWAACCLAFFAFLRSGELTVPAANQFDPTWHLTPDDIMVDDRINPKCLFVRVKGSKTDQTRQGVTLCVGRTYTELCPVAAMVAYLSVRKMDHGPLFKLQTGQPLTRQKLVDLLKEAVKRAGINAEGYSGHSFRIGAATTAAANGVGDAVIQTLGRWSSDSYTRYIRIPQDELAQLSHTLAKD